jgi:hypothetical protein
MSDASLVVLNANVITLDARKPRAQAIAIQNNKIVAVGTNKQIRKLKGKNTKVINAKGATVVPGLVDCHVHMMGFGFSLQELELRNVKSIKELQRRLRDYARKNSGKEWIIGRHWDQSRFKEKRYPTCHDLDVAVADKPVFLTRVCGHIAVVNTRALQLTAITEKTTVEGGKVDLDEKTGEPSGILRENAVDIVQRAVPKPTESELERAYLSACRKAAKAGLTCVHWMLNSAKEIRATQKLWREGKLSIRTLLGIPVSLLNSLTDLGLLTGFGDDMLKIGPVKILADGSLGGQTAALKEPYADKPETSGMMLYTEKELNRLVTKAHKAGLQLAIHAIGDRTMEAVLKAYEKALRKHPRKDHRHRIEHCSVLNPELIKKMKKLNLIASVQPHFVASDFWVTDRVGKHRARWVFPFKTLMKEGLTMVSGSDCPVEPINPILGIWAAAARKSFPEERLTTEEALKTYTVNAAYASFDEDKRGTIVAGKLADLTLLSEDVLKIPPEEIKNVKVEMTIVDGKVVYARKR